jgi:hypothetical protein
VRCDSCPALLKEGYEYPEGYCGLGEEEKEFFNGTFGCNRRSTTKIEKDLKNAQELEIEAFAEECGRMVEFWENEDKLNIEN